MKRKRNDEELALAIPSDDPMDRALSEAVEDSLRLLREKLRRGASEEEPDRLHDRSRGHTPES